MAAGKKQNDKDAMAVINEHIKNESYAPVRRGSLPRYIFCMGRRGIS